MSEFKFGDNVVSDDYSIIGYIVFDEKGKAHAAYYKGKDVMFFKIDEERGDFKLYTDNHFN